MFSQTTISFSVAKSGYTTLGVYDMKGVEVARLYQASAEGGKVYRANFESKHLPSGVYIVRLATGKQVETYKLVLMR
ncbi:MAG: T9SS type A sorting domain-containing protein [Segetibacter sp.]